jgi:hypothetical protein
MMAVALALIHLKDTTRSTYEGMTAPTQIDKHVGPLLLRALRRLASNSVKEVIASQPEQSASFRNLGLVCGAAYQGRYC